MVNQLHYFKLDNDGDDQGGLANITILKNWNLSVLLHFYLFCIIQNVCYLAGITCSWIRLQCIQLYTIYWKMTVKQITSNDKIISLLKYNSICYQYHKLYKTPDLLCTEHDSAIFPAV